MSVPGQEEGVDQTSPPPSTKEHLQTVYACLPFPNLLLTNADSVKAGDSKLNHVDHVISMRAPIAAAEVALDDVANTIFASIATWGGAGDSAEQALSVKPGTSKRRTIVHQTTDRPVMILGSVRLRKK